MTSSLSIQSLKTKLYILPIDRGIDIFETKLKRNDKEVAKSPELRFVATVTTGGRVKFVPVVEISLENNAISRIICVELQALYIPSVILH